MGITGEIATAARHGQYSYRYWYSEESIYLDAFYYCDKSLRDSLGRNPTLVEIQECIRENPRLSVGIYDGGYLVKSGIPAAGVIGNQISGNYPLPTVNLVKVGQGFTIDLKRPGGSSDLTKVNDFTISVDDPSIATFEDGNASITGQWAITQDIVRIRIVGIKDGSTGYRIATRTSVGNAFNGAAQVNVGSSYQFEFLSLNLLAGEQRDVALFRNGVLTSAGFVTVASLSSGNSEIASITPASTNFVVGEGTKLVDVLAGIQVGTTTITAFDPVHDLRAMLTVNVLQEVTLDRLLIAPDGTRFEKGTKIRTDRMVNFRISPPDRCTGYHLHSVGPGLIIDGKGPIADPNSDACGYGQVIQPR